ncbi:MAG: GNAT family N-acetyltransferase [Xanthobacteraceae bacterium]
MASSSYGFGPMTAGDFPIVRRWLVMPHVSEWWGDPDEQFALVSDDLSHRAMDQFIVELDRRPFAYLQCYDPNAWANHGFGALPHGARGIDQFIGEEDMIAQGHGSALVRAFADGLLDTGVPQVLTDPSPANTRAIRAYEKAGFGKDRPVTTPDGAALLMVRNP